MDNYKKIDKIEHLNLNAVSDLHLEFDDLKNLPKFKFSPEAEILVLMGDIVKGSKKQGVLNEYIEWFLDISKNFKYVIYVAGNHEFYGTRMDKFYREFKKKTEGSNIILLEKETFIYKNYKFIGSTNWFDFKFNRKTELINLYLDQNIERITDFKKIKIISKGSYRKLNPTLVYYMNQKSKKFILDELNKDDGYKNILVTHHGVFKECIVEELLNLPLDYTETNEWNDLILNSKNPPVLALNGHSHKFLDHTFNNSKKTRLIMNARGYNEYDLLIEEFKSDFLIKA